jgi:hypothetical protein
LDSNRADKPDITATRSPSLISDQSEISATVRPQPMQRLIEGSTTQIFTHGVAGAGARISMRVI